MHKKTIKRNVFHPVTQKVEAPQYSHSKRNKISQLCLNEYEDDKNERKKGMSLSSIQKQDPYKEIDSSSSWEQNSTSTSVSWAEEIENVTTQKLIEEWDAIERTLYNEVDEVPPGQILDECMQWKSQIPHLRVIGENPFVRRECKSQKQNTIDDIDRVERSERYRTSKDTDVEFSLLRKETDESLENITQRKLQDVLNTLSEYVYSQLFPSTDNETDLLSNTLNETLKIAPAPLHRNKIYRKSTKSSGSEQISVPPLYQNKHLNITNISRFPENSEIDRLSQRSIQKRDQYSVSASKLKSSRKVEDEILTSESRLYTPQHSRNKLGTVFNKKIIVSPVPFVVSTRESFSTLKTIPIQFMERTVKTTQGSTTSALKILSKKTNDVRISHIQSGWQAPVCPTVWPKNIRLAPIDISRLPSSRNRTQASSSAMLQRNIKPLSPISRSLISSTPHVSNSRSNRLLEIEGRHISTESSTKLNLLPTSSDCSSRVAKSKKSKLHERKKKR